MKCFIFSLLLAQIAVTLLSVLLSFLVVIPSFTITNAWKAIGHIMPLAQVFAFLPAAALIALLTFSPMSVWKSHAPLGGALIGSVLYMIIGVWPLVQKLESWPINMIPALVFNAIVGALYGLSIGAAVKFAGASTLCNDN